MAEKDRPCPDFRPPSGIRPQTIPVTTIASPPALPVIYFTHMTTFQTLGLPDGLVTALARLNIHTPTDVQAQAFPTLSEGQDAWLSAPTGSGKTLAYLLPLIAKLDRSTIDLQVAVLVPTQELAVQINDTIRELDTTASLGLRCQLLIGNASIIRQKEKLKKKPHIVVGTSGRMLDLGLSGKLKLHKCRAVCIDEADNLLAKDHIGDIQAFLKLTPSERQLVFASATAQGSAFKIAETLGHNVQWIRGENLQTHLPVEHFYIGSSYNQKTDVIREFLKIVQPEKTLVFAMRNETAEHIGRRLEKSTLPHAVLHGGMDKFERQMAMKQFRQGTARILIASDLAARGMDIKGLTHVINFDLPPVSGDYLHRVGRTGRMGAPGVALSIVTEDELKLLQRYERDLKITVHPASLQNNEFVTSTQSKQVIQKNPT